MDHQEIERILPSLALAREQGLAVRSRSRFFWRRKSLVDRRPSAERRSLAIVVFARVQARTEWSEKTQISEAALNALLKQSASERFKNRSYRYVKEKLSAQIELCTFCTPDKSGWTRCGVCSGSGLVTETRYVQAGHQTEVEVPCYACHGAGVVDCGVCDGSGKAHPVSLAHVEEKVHSVSTIVLPELSSHLSEEVRNDLSLWRSFPPLLKTDLQNLSSMGPYRGAEKQRDERWGFRYGDTRVEIKRILKNLFSRGEIIAYEVDTYTIPILELKFGKHSVVLIRAANGDMKAFVD